MPLNFSDALADLKRRSRLQGREVSEQEVTGIAAGYSEQASSRLARQRQLELNKQRHEETLAQQKEQYDETTRMAAENRHEDRVDARHSEQRAAYAQIVGWFADRCIIITTCTSKNSHDVEISREFRDKYMSKSSLGGYYAIASIVVPLLNKSKFLRLLTKRFLVDRLVDYGEWILGYKPKMRLRTSRIATEAFLSMCGGVGMHINVEPYIEAHR